MPTVFLRFYAELNDFLPVESRQIESGHSFDGRVTMKEMIESLGVPPTEVDLILVEGRGTSPIVREGSDLQGRSSSVDFSYLVRDGDRISVYPVFEALNIASLVRLRAHPLRELRFLLDRHLDELATSLRLLDFDALYSHDYFSSSPLGRGQGEGRSSSSHFGRGQGEWRSYDETLVQISVAEKRILLTRDRALMQRKEITHGYCVLATEPEEQLREVIERFDLSDASALFEALHLTSDV